MLAKEKKGITLIALVITIIILLILAGITLSALMGENGLIENTKTSIDRYKRSRAEEKVTLAVNASFGVGGDLEYQGEDSTLVNNLKNVNGIDKSTVPNPITQFPFTVVVDGYDIDVNWTTKTGDTENIPSIPDDPDDIPDENDDEDLPPSKPLEDFKDYIPIYTEEQYTKIATEEKGYVITDLTGKTIGSYDMNKDAKYVLMNDITFKKEHTSIDEFKGTLEGNGYRIYNLTIKDSYGMFNILSGATLNNISLHNMNVSSQTNLGLIAASSENTSLNNCYLVDSTGATVLTKDANGKSLPHGIAGFVGDAKEGTNIKKGKVIRSTLTSDTIGYYISAVVGQTSGTTTVEGISVLGTTGNPESYKTGIVENANATTIVKDCHVQNIGFLDCYSRTGGIISVARDADLIVDSCTVKNINAQTKWFAGIISDAYDETKTKTIEIKNCKISDFIAEGYDIGGFISLSKGYDSIKVSNSTAKSCELVSSNGSTSMALIRHLENTKQLTVENVLCQNIKSNWGVIGFFSGTGINISRCFLKDSDLNYTSKYNSYPYVNSGIVAEIQWAEEINISACGVSNSSIKSSAEVGGILGRTDNGISERTINIKNCYSINNTLTVGNKYDGDIGGIACYVSGENATVSNSKVEGCIIQGVKKIAGVLSYSGSNNLIISGCEITNNILDKNQKNAAGVISDGRNVIITGCSLKNNTINSTNYASGVVAIINEGKIENCKLEGGNIVGTNRATGIVGYNDVPYGRIGIEVENCIVSDVEKIEASNDSAMGIGFVDGKVKNCSVKNVKEIKTNEGFAAGIGTAIKEMSGCSVEDTHIIGTANMGGLVSFISGAKELNYNNNFVKNCVIEQNPAKSGYGGNHVGGIIGCISYYSSDEQKLFNSNNVYSTDIIINTDLKKTWNAGGIIGFLDFNDMNIENCTADNVNIILKKDSNTTEMLGTEFKESNRTSFMIGGIVGFGGSNIKSCSFVNSSITSELDSFFGMGGIVGVGSNKEISNCVVDNSIIKGDSGIGGISGLASQKVTNCEFKNSTIEATGDYIGGIQGIAGAKTETANWATEMNGCKVTSSTIKAPISTDKDDEHYILQGKNSYYISESTVEDADKKYDTFTNCTVTDVTRIEK